MRQYLIAAVVVSIQVMLQTPASAQLISHYTFDKPLASASSKEEDLGSDKTPLPLLHNAKREAENAFPGSSNALRVGPVAGPKTANDDFKAGIYFAEGSKTSTLVGTKNATGITIMGWFKRHSAITGTTSMIGLLRGDEGIAPSDHDGRALIEIEGSGATAHIIALGRRLDIESSYNPAAAKKKQIHSSRNIDQDLPIDKWSHIAAVFDFIAGTITLYCNGEMIGSSTDAALVNQAGDWNRAPNANPGRASNTPAGGLKVGGQIPDDSTPFDGWIDEIRIYNVALPRSSAKNGELSIQSVFEAYGTKGAGAATHPAADSLYFRVSLNLAGLEGPSLEVKIESQAEFTVVTRAKDVTWTVRGKVGQVKDRTVPIDLQVREYESETSNQALTTHLDLPIDQKVNGFGAIQGIGITPSVWTKPEDK